VAVAARCNSDQQRVVAIAAAPVGGPIWTTYRDLATGVYGSASGARAVANLLKTFPPSDRFNAHVRQQGGSMARSVTTVAGVLTTH
jgi:alkylated DNA nucleotide flippase Atl1